MTPTATQCNDEESHRWNKHENREAEPVQCSECELWTWFSYGKPLAGFVPVQEPSQ